MLFSKSVPEEVASYPTTKQFLDVLDSVQVCKQRIIAESMRANNPLLCTNEMWLLKYLADYGFTKVPEGIPIAILQQMVLNADLIFRLRGSSLGVQILCNICTLGIARVDTSDFIKDFSYLLPDSVIDGYITDSNEDDSFRYLIDNNYLNEERSLTITIYGGIRNDAVEEYLRNAIEDYVGFHPNCEINFIHRESLADYSEIYHALLNTRFINKGQKTYFLRRNGVLLNENIKVL